MNFATWFAQRRREVNLTLRELAKKSGLSLAYVAALEQGTSEAPPLKTCKALARGLGLRWEDVWERASAARLRKWLKREGYGIISEPELLDLLKRIRSPKLRAAEWLNC